MLLIGLLMIAAGIGLLWFLRHSARQGRHVLLSEALDFAFVPPLILGLCAFGIAITVGAIAE